MVQVSRQGDWAFPRNWLGTFVQLRVMVNPLAMVFVVALGSVLITIPATAQQDSDEEATETLLAEQTGTPGQSRESMANDATASQWSFQVAFEARNWFDDIMTNGLPRPAGNKNMGQFRIVAPLDKEQSKIGIPVLPRLTFRNEEAFNGTSGSGNAELFILGILKEWAAGRFGIGPQINFPADKEQFGSTVWRYGLATAALQRTGGDKIMLGLLIQQVWGQIRPDSDVVVANPITIQPVFNYSLPKAFYLNIGETALSYDWQNAEWLIPVGIRVGKLFIGDKDTWNVYLEYRTSVVYKDWLGSAVKDALRINVSYTIPI
jgi:hypothetical protein